MSFNEIAPPNWKMVKLSSLGEVNRGRSRHRPRDAAHLYGGKYPFIQTGDVKASNGRINKFSQTYSEDGLNQSRLWPAGTMCITIAANIAETGILEFPACFPDSVIGFVPDYDKCDVHFIEYMFRLLKKRIQSQAIGSVQDNINLGTLERIEFPIPSLEKQKEIAKVLTCLDDKIQLNQQINQTLEQMAQAIFKSWFVDFEPVKAKMAARAADGSDEDALLAAMQAISGKDADQLAIMQAQQPEQYAELQATAELFPSALQKSELGQIPKSWQVSNIDQTTSLIIDHRGKTPKKLGGDWSGSGYIALSAKHIKNGHIVNREQLRCVNEGLYAKWMKEELQNGDILLTSEGPMGELYYLSGDEKYCLSQRLYALRADAEKINPSFLYYWLNSPVARADMEGRATGTTVVGIRQAELRKVKVICPPKQLADAFEKVAQSSLDASASLTGETLSLSAMRDSLLPRLLSGEIMVEGAE